MRTLLIALLAIGLLAACSKPQPVFYPNSHLQSVGQAQADADVAQCRQMAEASGLKQGTGKGDTAKRSAIGAAAGAAVGAATGAIIGSAGVGAAVGGIGGAASGAGSGVADKGNTTYRNFVNRCLGDKGYDVIGWE